MAYDTLRRSFSLLGTPRFGTFWFASLLSSIGTWAQTVAEPWLLLSLGASSFLIGLDSFAMGAPVFLLTLVGGALADRGDRRHVIALFQSIQMLCPTLIVVLLFTHSIQPWIVIVLSLIIGVTDALSMPSFQTIVPSIVTREQLPTGIALNTTQFNLSRILGPAVAGLLMSSVGAAGAFAVSALSYVPFILIALWILPRGAPGATGHHAFDFRGLGAGLRDVIRAPMMRGAVLSVLLTSVLTAPLITFAPVLVKDEFQGAASHFSLVVGAFGAGGLLGALVLLGIDPRRDRRPIGCWTAIAYAGLVVLVALDRWFWALPILFVLAGAAMTVSNAAANTLLLASAPDGLRGRAISVYMLALRGGVSVGALITGASVTLLGVRTALCVNGVLALAAHLANARAWGRAGSAAPAG
ncbi:MAG: MFS transporter [Gammaproteobacteria bacterium]